MKPPTLAEIHEARDRIADHARRTPLVRFDDDTQGTEVWLKLENLQPVGSFKLRGALNKMRSLDRSTLGDGVVTASAGNMAQGVAYAARVLGVQATIVVPDSAPVAKLDAIERLGGRLLKVPYTEWWETMRTRERAGVTGVFIHPFADSAVLAGNGTIALEIHEELPDVDAVLVPWGGGGLTTGIAAAFQALSSPTRVFACEVEGAAPLAASLAAKRPVAIENRKSFIDGIGGREVFPEMWPLAQSVVAGSLTASVADVATAVRFVAQRARVVAEGAGATPVAIARTGLPTVSPRPRRVVCIVSGGNIDAAVLASILAGQVP